MTTYKVFILDDHKIVRDGLKAILLARPEFMVIGEAGSCQDASRLLPSVKPDIVFVDLRLPDGNGAQFILNICALLPEAKCILLTAEPNAADLQKAREAGAAGFLTKDIDQEEYFKALEKVCRGEKYISAVFSQLLVEESSPLSDRELEVLRLFAEGLSYKETAAQLGISPRTVETHKNHLMEKMQVKSIVELVRKAIREGIISA